jgi:hypothetical protein
MKQLLCSMRGRLALVVCLASVMTVLVSENRASAQQGKYVTEAADRLTKLINHANKADYVLQNNSFSIGGGWLKQSKKDWIPLFTVQLTAGKSYRFLAAGDADAKDVDLEILDDNNKIVAQDAETDPTATVDFTPRVSGRYTVRIRLYGSDNNDPCVCLAVVMTKK